VTSTTSRDRVLVVEDDPTTRLGLTELVRTWGFTTEAAADGEEALQRIIAFRPSIIISDLVMSRMGGLDLLRSLKDEGGDLTVVILTAQGKRSGTRAVRTGQTVRRAGGGGTEGAESAVLPPHSRRRPRPWLPNCSGAEVQPEGG